MDRGEKEGQRRLEGERDGWRRRIDRGREKMDRQRKGEYG